MAWYLYSLWLAQIPLCVLLMALMVCSGFYRQFPFFFSYNLEAAVATIIFFFFFHAAKYWHIPHFTWSVYGYGYFVEQAVNTALRFAVIYEIFANVFNSYVPLKGMGKPIFRSALLLLLVIALALAALTPRHDPYFSMYALHVLEQTASILQVGLLVVLFVFSAYAGLSWRNFVFGGGLGLGVYASIKLAVAALQSAMVIQNGSKLVNVLLMGAFDMAVMIWLFYLLMPDPASAPPADQNIADWNRELQRLP
jgi:hypothetical protein